MTTVAKVPNMQIIVAAIQTRARQWISVKGYDRTLILYVQMKKNTTTCINEIVAHIFTT